MARQVDTAALVTAILLAVLIGAAAGFGVSLVARQMGWSASLAGPLTGAIVGGLVLLLDRSRAQGGNDPSRQP